MLIEDQTNRLLTFVNSLKEGNFPLITKIDHVEFDHGFHRQDFALYEH